MHGIAAILLGNYSSEIHRKRSILRQKCSLATQRVSVWHEVEFDGVISYSLTSWKSQCRASRTAELKYQVHGILGNLISPSCSRTINFIFGGACISLAFRKISSQFLHLCLLVKSTNGPFISSTQTCPMTAMSGLHMMTCRS